MIDLLLSIISKWNHLLSIVFVGAFWGCTNPILRRGAADDITACSVEEDATFFSLLDSLKKFRRFGVWLPYLFNQCGSLLYYYLLASSDLTLAVPVCNALSLVFSIMTSYALGERVDKPGQAIFGAALVTGGVAICIASREKGFSEDNGLDVEL